MGKLYDSFDDLIFLFVYGREADMEKYIDFHSNLYIDKTNGKLITRSFMCTDPFSLRAGTVSVHEYPNTYNGLKKILLTEEIKDGYKYESLNEDNWQQWLKTNNLL